MLCTLSTCTMEAVQVGKRYCYYKEVWLIIIIVMHYLSSFCQLASHVFLYSDFCFAASNNIIITTPRLAQQYCIQGVTKRFGWLYIFGLNGQILNDKKTISVLFFKKFSSLVQRCILQLHNKVIMLVYVI